MTFFLIIAVINPSVFLKWFGAGLGGGWKVPFDLTNSTLSLIAASEQSSVLL